MTWRIGLIDSCGAHPRAVAAAAFVGLPPHADEQGVVADATGHGTRVANVLSGGHATIELVLGQVFVGSARANAASVAAAVDWAVSRGAHMLHLSLGLAGDRPVLASAVQRALDAGVLVVAARPARGAPVYPASYAGVIRATGDARCAVDEISHLGFWTFGAAPRTHTETGGAIPERGGASVGAAWVTRAITYLPTGISASCVVETLSARAAYCGIERKTLSPTSFT
jgi:Subtilase family